MYDSIFPNPISGFRMAEFIAILSQYKNSRIIVDPKDYHIFNQSDLDHIKDLRLLKNAYPAVYAKTYKGSVNQIQHIQSRLFYCVFLNIIYECLPFLEKSKKNFLFTLYPGGGFNIKDKIALEKLKVVLQSPYFKGVIVTQEFTKQFLIQNYNCPEDKIYYIFGGIIPQSSINNQRLRVYKNSMTLNLCFCAARYMKNGLDKGYDIFVEVAKVLLDKKYNVHFNVIGGHEEHDIPLEQYKNSFTFYGYKKYEELSKIFLEQDFILSPNRPFTLSDGSFDGFPLGAVVEAALNGVIPILTDELKQNSQFSESELIVVKPNVMEIVNTVENLLKNEQKIEFMSQKIQLKCREIYSNSNQLNERLKIFEKYL